MVSARAGLGIGLMMGLAIGGPLAILTYGSIRDAVQSGEEMNFSLDNFTTDVPPAQLAQVCALAPRLRARVVCLLAVPRSLATLATWLSSQPACASDIRVCCRFSAENQGRLGPRARLHLVAAAPSFLGVLQRRDGFRPDRHAGGDCCAGGLEQLVPCCL